MAEKDLRKQGSLYNVPWRIPAMPWPRNCGYDISKAESSLVCVTFPGKPANLKVKNITGNAPVCVQVIAQHRFVNVFPSTKWDADVTWQQALINHIRGLKAELRIN